MFKLTVAVILSIVVCIQAKAGFLGAPLAYTAPVVAAAPYVAATSSQVVSRNYNGLAAAPLIAAASPYAAYTAAAYTAPIAAAYSAYPYTARYASPYVSAYTSPYAAYSPYAAAPVLL